MNRPGYYVEGKYFAARAAQAMAFAQHRANEFGRAVVVTLKEFTGTVQEVAKQEPQKDAVAA